jgi:hypothetical protein
MVKDLSIILVPPHANQTKQNQESPLYPRYYGLRAMSPKSARAKASATAASGSDKRQFGAGDIELHCSDGAVKASSGASC